MTSEQRIYIEQQLRHATEYIIAGYRNMIIDGHMALRDIPALSEVIGEIVQEIYEEFYEADWHGSYPTFKQAPDWVADISRNDVTTLAVGIYWNEYADKNEDLFPS